jgi:hypothetical protein
MSLASINYHFSIVHLVRRLRLLRRRARRVDKRNGTLRRCLLCSTRAPSRVLNLIAQQFNNEKFPCQLARLLVGRVSHHEGGKYDLPRARRKRDGERLCIIVRAYSVVNDDSVLVFLRQFISRISRLAVNIRAECDVLISRSRKHFLISLEAVGGETQNLG